MFYLTFVLSGVVLNETTVGAGITGYLKFMVCNGLTNQRQSILEAALLAKELGLGLVLPHLISNGIQDLRQGNAPVLVTSPEEAGGMPFSTIFDETLFSEAMDSQGVPIVPEYLLKSMGPEFQYAGGPFPYDAFRRSGSRSVALGCALFSTVGHTPHLAVKYEHFLGAIMAALKPPPTLRAIVDQVKAALGTGPYDAIHLRYERDWWPLCEYWRAHPISSPDPANCGLWVPADLVRLLKTDFSVGSRPLYIAIDESALDDSSLLPLFRRSFSEAGVLTRDGILKGISLSREVGAQVDYHVSLDAEVWVGNSYSTFSGFLILERQLSRKGLRGTFWYNGGDVPLSHFFPIIQTKWVFVTGPSLEGQASPEVIATRIAVISAKFKGGLDPVCLYAGEFRDEFSSWLEAMGVEVVYHSKVDALNLASKLIGALQSSNDKDTRKVAALNKLFNEKGALSPGSHTFKLLLALTLPLTPSLQGFHYAIVTSPFVSFDDRPHGFLLHTRLPACLSMVPERGGEETEYAFSSHVAYTGLSCLKNRLSSTASALGEILLSSRGGSRLFKSAPHSSLMDWVRAYTITLNRAYTGLVTPISPRWNAQVGAPLEPFSILSSSRPGVSPCDAKGGFQEGEASVWTHPSFRMHAIRVGRLISGSLTDTMFGFPVTKRADWGEACLSLLESKELEPSLHLNPPADERLQPRGERSSDPAFRDSMATGLAVPEIQVDDVAKSDLRRSLRRVANPARRVQQVSDTGSPSASESIIPTSSPLGLSSPTSTISLSGASSSTVTPSPSYPSASLPFFTSATPLSSPSLAASTSGTPSPSTFYASLTESASETSSPSPSYFSLTESTSGSPSPYFSLTESTSAFSSSLASLTSSPSVRETITVIPSSSVTPTLTIPSYTSTFSISVFPSPSGSTINSATITLSQMQSSTEVATRSPSLTPSVTFDSVVTATPTLTVSPSLSSTMSSSNSFCSTTSVTPIVPPSQSIPPMPSSSPASSFTPSASPASSFTPSATSTLSATRTPSRTPSPTLSSTRSITRTPFPIPPLLSPSPSNPLGSNTLTFLLIFPANASIRTDVIAAFSSSPALGPALRASMLSLCRAYIPGVTEVYIDGLWGTPISDDDQINRLAVTFGREDGYSITPGASARRRFLAAPSPSTGVSFKLLFPGTTYGGGGLTKSASSLVVTTFSNPVIVNAFMSPAFRLIAKNMGVSNFSLGGAFVSNYTIVPITLATGSSLSFLADYTLEASIVPSVLFSLLLIAGFYYFKCRKRKSARLPTRPLTSIAPPSR